MVSATPYRIQSSPFGGLTWKDMQEQEEQERKEQARIRKEEQEMEQAHTEFLECMEGV